MGVSLTAGGQNFEVKAEVGLLTRNVLVRGKEFDSTLHVPYNDLIEECEEGFDSGRY